MPDDVKMEPLVRDDWQWLADQLRAWPERRVHPERTMSIRLLHDMAAAVIEHALSTTPASDGIAPLSSVEVSNCRVEGATWVNLGQPEPSPKGSDVESDIRIAIWNAGMKGGMGQDLSSAFIDRAMSEPTMQRALSTRNEALDERAQIVAWLRSLAKDEWYPHNLADAIERGEHLSTKGSD